MSITSPRPSRRAAPSLKSSKPRMSGTLPSSITVLLLNPSMCGSQPSHNTIVFPKPSMSSPQPSFCSPTGCCCEPICILQQSTGSAHQGARARSCADAPGRRPIWWRAAAIRHLRGLRAGRIISMSLRLCHPDPLHVRSSNSPACMFIHPRLHVDLSRSSASSVEPVGLCRRQMCTCSMSRRRTWMFSSG